MAVLLSAARASRSASDSYLTYGVLIACSTTVLIGERCRIGFNSSVYDGNHRYVDYFGPPESAPEELRGSAIG